MVILFCSNRHVGRVLHSSQGEFDIGLALEEKDGL